MRPPQPEVDQVRDKRRCKLRSELLAGNTARGQRKVYFGKLDGNRVWCQRRRRVRGYAEAARRLRLAYATRALAGANFVGQKVRMSTAAASLLVRDDPRRMYTPLPRPVPPTGAGPAQDEDGGR
eukprot:gene44946-59483_t